MMQAQTKQGDTYQGITTDQVQKADTLDLLKLHDRLHERFDQGKLNNHLKSTVISNLLVHQELFKRGLLIHKTSNDLDLLSAQYADAQGVPLDTLTELALDPKSDHLIKLLPVEKAEEDRQIVFGVVLEPGTVDAQGDTLKAETIEIAAHRWLAKFQDRGLMHNKIINSKIEIYESYIAPVNLTMGGQKVKKGTWLLMYHVLDSALWKKIKSGELTGFSMGGVGTREEPT